ncbi:MAG: exodeoxyribonuclease VII large subunit [Candidatus Chlorobium antarcticum]|jgi:exodeoxyribonuclease VII large subunit|nr:exodeoxyribonuclease VII large subunit [Candidatus Chlorobium antarcticum]
MAPSILSVSELTQQIKQELEILFPKIQVKGEISNFKHHSSGHIYMTLKDEGAQIPAVIWKHAASRLTCRPADGMNVIAEGRIEVYPPSGRYQLICTSITEEGEGALQQAFAKLLQKLAAAGWFGDERKKPIPKIPKIIGLVTSPTGAVIEDMGKVLQRRFPPANILLFPAKVQGRDAVDSLISGINWFNAQKSGPYRPDVIIIARGGGSLEDLQAFNEERVAEAIFNSQIPVISAVGHETDFTIADMVADLRAGTPSIAAELAVPDSLELLRHIASLAATRENLLKAKIDGAEREIESICSSYAFNRPMLQMQQFTEELDGTLKRMARTLEGKQRETGMRLESATRHLALLDYRKTLERGYTMVRKNGKMVTSAKHLHAEETVDLLFHDGTLPAEIRSGPRP